MSITKYQFAVYKNAIPKRICDQIIKTGISEKGKIGTTFSTNEIPKNEKESYQNLKKLFEKRDSNICWLNYPWIYKVIVPWVNKAMKEFNWNYETSFFETSQFTIYYPGGFYDWHQDSFTQPEVLKKNNGLNRKISLSILLNDPSEYEGGDFEFDMRNHEDPKFNKIEKVPFKEQGTLIIFPSFSFHRVLPVTKGVRYSLVNWVKGPDWR